MVAAEHSANISMALSLPFSRASRKLLYGSLAITARQMLPSLSPPGPLLLMQQASSSERLPNLEDTPLLCFIQPSVEAPEESASSLVLPTQQRLRRTLVSYASLDSQASSVSSESEPFYEEPEDDLWGLALPATEPEETAMGSRSRWLLEEPICSPGQGVPAKR